MCNWTDNLINYHNKSFGLLHPAVSHIFYGPSFSGPRFCGSIFFRIKFFTVQIFLDPNFIGSDSGFISGPLRRVIFSFLVSAAAYADVRQFVKRCVKRSYIRSQ